MITRLVRWFSIVLVSSFLLPVSGWLHTPLKDTFQIHNFYLPLVKNDPTLMAYVPGGEFLMGCYEAPGTCDDDNENLHAVWLDSYFIDIFEVTNAKFAKCVEAGGCIPPEPLYSNTHPSYYDNPTFANYPVLYST
jgi:formylglycine-generating enzyme required for sulfatase activity